MQISSKFTIAVHMMTCMAYFTEMEKVTSDFLAGSVGTNPVIIRNLMLSLKNAGLIEVKRGTGGATIKKSLEEITLFDLYTAVENEKEKGIFRFHENPNPACPVGSTIHKTLDGRLAQIQDAMEAQMRSVTLWDVIRDTREFNL